MLRDPAKTGYVDPVTHEIRQRNGVNAFNGAKIVTGVAIGDLNGDGKPEVLSAVNEQYDETPNTSDPLPTVTGAVLTPGNQRVYAIYANGSRHGGGPGHPKSHFPNANAFLPGWPAHIATLTLELLPVVGDGPTGSPVLAPVTGDAKRLDTGIDGTAGPAYILDPHGVSIYGRDAQGRDRTLSTSGMGAQTNSVDKPTSIPGVGGGIFTRLQSGQPPAYAIPAVGVGKLLDLVLPEDQIVSDNTLAVYDTSTTGTQGQLPAFPREVNDLQFLATPSSADIDGKGGEEVLEGSAYSDVHAFSLDGSEPGLSSLSPYGWPKFTGGWTLGGPAVGDFNGDGKRDIASTTREGNVYVWHGNGAGNCAAASWPEWGHDGWNTDNLVVDAVRPSPARHITAHVTRGKLTVSWHPSGDDGRCGHAAGYDVRWSRHRITSATFARAHWLGHTTKPTLTVARPGPHRSLPRRASARRPTTSGDCGAAGQCGPDRAQRRPRGQLRVRAQVRAAGPPRVSAHRSAGRWRRIPAGGHRGRRTSCRPRDTPVTRRVTHPHRLGRTAGRATAGW